MQLDERQKTQAETIARGLDALLAKDHYAANHRNALFTTDERNALTSAQAILVRRSARTMGERIALLTRARPDGKENV